MKAAEISPVTLEQVLSHYPSLGTLRATVRNGLSRNHAACLLETTTGRYFAKGYELRWSDRSALQGEHAIIRHLVLSGYPTPRLHENTESETLTWLDGIPYALFDEARGEDRYGHSPVFTPFATRGEAFSAGSHLARLHLNLQSMPPLPPRSFNGLTARYQLMEEASISEGFKNLLPTSPLLQQFLAERPEVPWLLARMSGYRDRLAEAWPHCPRGPIHGDFIKRNLLWEGQEVASVLDFDLWNEGAWVYDLALALLPCGFNWTDLLESIGEVNRQALGAFLEGYQAFRPLEEAERVVLPWVMESARFEFYLSAIAASLDRGDPPQAEQFWRLLVGVFDWFERHHDWKRGFFC